MATIIHFDGREEQIEPKNGTDFQLDELKPIAGEGAPAGEDYIEVYPLKDGRIIVLNESGKLIGLPRNEKATILCQFPSPAERQHMADEMADMFGDHVIMIGFEPDEPDYIAGTVLVCRSDEVK